MTFHDLDERAKRLMEVNKIVVQLDESIRAKAFDLLSDYVADESTMSAGSDPKRNMGETHITNPRFSAEGFYSSFSHDKPADNAVLIAAGHYAQYGSEPFSLDEIRDTAAAVGLTIPERLDMTLKSATREGKALFRPEERGRYRPTVHGEMFFRKTYNVTKGSGKRAD